MAVYLDTPINDFCFLSELDRIVFSITGDQTMEVSIAKDSQIFRNTYIPDENSKVIIYDLDKVLEPYLDLDDIRSNKFILDIGADEPIEFIVIPCSVAVTDAAMYFVDDFFLTPMMGERDTCLGRFETITPFTIAESAYTVVASYFNGTSLQSRRFAGSTTGDGSPIDVSPARFVDDSLGTLVSYEVHCGKRTARYRVLPSLPEADPAIMFRNCFGCWETIYLTGTKTQQPEYTRSSAIIDGKYKVYDIIEEMSWVAHTGPLRPGMIAVASDLARTRSAFLLDRKGNIGDEIVIIDCDCKTGNDDDEIPDMKFTFRRADNRSALIQAIRPPKVFDEHFNYTFH